MFARRKKAVPLPLPEMGPGDGRQQPDRSPGAPQPAPAAPRKKRRSLLLRVLAGACKALALLLLLSVLGAAAALVWVCQSGSGQAWLLETANNFLDNPADRGRPGLRFRLTALSGTLPFDMRIGLEAYDAEGLWLSAPDNHLLWNWRELPGSVSISALRLENAVLERLPQMPQETAPPEPDKPLALADIRSLLGQAAAFLAAKPWWLPDVALRNVELANASLPAALLAAGGEGSLRADASLGAGYGAAGVMARLECGLRGAQGQAVALPGASFSGAKVEAGIDLTPQPGGIAGTAALSAGVERPALSVSGLPADMLGGNIGLRLELTALARTPDGGPATEARLDIVGPDLDAGHVRLAGKGSWQSGRGFAEDRLDGPLNVALDLNFKNPAVPPDSPLAMLRAPVSLSARAEGELERPSLAVALKCGELEAGGHAIRNLALDISGRELSLPLDGEFLKPGAPENGLDLKLAAMFDREPLGLSTRFFYRGAEQPDESAQRRPLPQLAGLAKAWSLPPMRAGLRNLKLEALGLSGAGGLEMLLARGVLPRLDGTLKFRVLNWQAVNAFMPGSELAGNVALDLELENKAGAQGVVLEAEAPELRFSGQGGADAISLQNLNVRARLDDAFASPAVDAKIGLGRMRAFGLDIGARAAAAGNIEGPVRASLESEGTVRSSVAVAWRPGEVDLQSLSISMGQAELCRLLGQPAPARPVTLGLRAERPAKITYGGDGLGVSGLSVAIAPSGRITASGGLSAQKLDLNLALSDLSFTPWQAVLPRLPRGGASLRASFSGSPRQPGGRFDLSLSDVQVPGVSLPPLNLSLAGAIRPTRANRGELTASLRLNPETVRALGGETAQVQAAIPLLFGENGIPGPDMDGPLSARVAWDGALGPIWNLLPVADMRLNGRLNIGINAGGTLKSPRVTGGVNIKQGRYENLLLGVLITNIELALALSDAGAPAAGGIPGSFRLDLSATDGRGGTVKVGGGGRLSGEGLDIAAKIDRLRPLRRRDVHIELSGDAKVAGAATAPVVTGSILVNQGEVLLNNLSFGGSVTTLDITVPDRQVKKTGAPAPAGASAGAAPASAPGGENRGSLDVRIRMLPRFVVEGRGLTSIWEANMLIQGTPENPQITGTINSVKGNFDFLGKNFILTRGVVAFAGGSLSDPLLDIELTNETPELTAHILITGSVSNMKLTLRSDPALPRDEILSRVLFGKSVGDLSRLEALQLAGAVAQLAGFGGNGSGIFDFTKKALGVDVLRLGTSTTGAAGQPGDDSAGGTTLEMGKYINDWIYMGVQQGFKADSTAFIIQLELTPRTSLELRTEQTNTWGGLNWKYNY